MKKIYLLLLFFPLGIMAQSEETKSESEKAQLTIKPTEFKNVYELTYSYDDVVNKQFVTPTEKVSSFDITVNHCPKTKRRD